MTSKYTSSLVTRVASDEMASIWSDDTKYRTWRLLWASLADAQSQFSTSISREQVRALYDAVDNIDYGLAAKYESQFHHDVVAHIHTLGDQAPIARPIIHLGVTSQFVCDNTDILLINKSLNIILTKLQGIISKLLLLADKYKEVSTLGYTHLQPAQPVTVGRRIAGWAYNLDLVDDVIEFHQSNLKLRGIQGTVGTQASLVNIVDDNIDKLNQYFCDLIKWSGSVYTLTTQTYPRVVDTFVSSSIGSLAAVAQKIATDIRLLASKNEIAEGFADTQVGSSAMPYKRNPIKCERICGLSKLIIALQQSFFTTAAEQWLERTLDDSSIRRVSIPEIFLAADGILDLLDNIIDHLQINQIMIRDNLNKYLPYLAVEEIIVKAVENGCDRQHIHEIIRKCACETTVQVNQGLDNDLLERLSQYDELADIIDNINMNPHNYIGRSVDQVSEYYKLYFA